MDDEPDWLSEDIVEEAPAPEVAPAEGEVQGETQGEAGAKAEGEAEPEPEPEPPRTPKDPNRLILFKHWSRPTTVQYNYLYDYRKNYYDDCIDFMDRRSRGITRDVPRAQTWAERALRTYAQKGATGSTALERSRTADLTMLSHMKTSGTFYRYHSKEYMSRRYPVLMG